MMGGEIHVESAVGLGSMFCFTVAYLPVAEADIPVFDLLAEEQSDTVGLFAGKTVLVVEPVDLCYLYYEKLLSVSGINVVRVGSQTKLNLDVMNAKAHAVLVSLSGAENTMPDTAKQYKIPIIYIVPGKLDEYRHLTRDYPNSVLLAEPVNFEILTGALKDVLA
jgi:hypothetical protein